MPLASPGNRWTGTQLFSNQAFGSALCWTNKTSSAPRSALVFECFGPRARHMVWHTMFMCLQSFPNFIWWNQCAFSGIFAHRSKTVTLGERKCSYLGTALPAFLARIRKKKGCIRPHNSVALAEVWGALTSLCGRRGSSETPVPCPEELQHPAWWEPTESLSCLMAVSSFHPVPTPSRQQLPSLPRTKNPLTGSVRHGFAGANLS